MTDTSHMTINEMIAAWDTPEERARQKKAKQEYKATPCEFDCVRECYVHGYYPRRPCGHCCRDVPCRTCNPPMTGRRRTRARWRRMGRR